MSRFDADIAGAVAGNHLYQFGRAGVRYLDPPHADPVELTVIPGHEYTEEDEDESGRKLIVTQEISFSADPDSQYGGVAHPKASAKIEIDGVEWKIALPMTVGANMVTLTIRRSLRIEHGMAGYRRPAR